MPPSEVAVRRRRWTVTVALLLAVFVLPVVRAGDDFPLSEYPMYARRRPDVVVLATARAEDDQGRPVRLSIGTIARTDDPLIASALVRDVIAGGRAPQLCEAIAGRAPAGTTIVRVVTEEHDVVARAEGRPSLLASEEAARCEVPA